MGLVQLNSELGGQWERKWLERWGGLNINPTNVMIPFPKVARFHRTLMLRQYNESGVCLIVSILLSQLFLTDTSRKNNLINVVSHSVLLSHDLVPDSECVFPL